MSRVRSLRLLRLASAAVLTVAAMTAGAAGSALASCVAPPNPVEAVNSADIVFVGKVTRAFDLGRSADVAVLEVWRGPDQPATVTINGGISDNLATSVDRTFVEGETYLFFPYANPESGKLQDNSCSNTALYTNVLSDLRPSDVRAPIGGTLPAPGFDLSPLLPIGLALAVFGVLLVVGLLARGRQEA